MSGRGRQRARGRQRVPFQFLKGLPHRAGGSPATRPQSLLSNQSMLGEPRSPVGAVGKPPDGDGARSELPLSRCPPRAGWRSSPHQPQPPSSEAAASPESPESQVQVRRPQPPAHPPSPASPQQASGNHTAPLSPPVEWPLPSAGARGLSDLSPRCPAGRVMVPLIADSAWRGGRAPARVTASGSQPAGEAGRPARCPWPPWGHRARPARPGAAWADVTGRGDAPLCPGPQRAPKGRSGNFLPPEGASQPSVGTAPARD